MKRPMWRIAIAVCVLTVLVGATGCTGDDEPNLPRVSATGDSSPSTAPPSPSDTAPSPSPSSAATTESGPGGADLDRAQESAYEKAVADQANATAVIDALNAAPRPNQATANRIKAVSYNPFSEAAFVEIQRLSKAGVRVEGQLRVEWRRPVRVDLASKPRPTVVWDICTTQGTRRVLKGDRQIPQDAEPQLGRITQYASSNGRWMIADVQGAGSCEG